MEIQEKRKKATLFGVVGLDLEKMNGLLFRSLLPIYHNGITTSCA